MSDNPNADDTWGIPLAPDEAAPATMPAIVPVEKDQSTEEELHPSFNVSKRESERLMEEVEKRWLACEQWEGNWRPLYLEDTRFVEGDSDNLYQWPQQAISARDPKKKPTLTVNKTAQLCQLILNDFLENPPEIKGVPTGGGATTESALAVTDLLRHVQYISNSQDVYSSAMDNLIKGGAGYWIVCADYIDDESFDQDIFIRRVPDPLNVYLDPFCEELDKSDARFGFYFKDIPNDQFDAEYSRFKHLKNSQSFDGQIKWSTQDTTRIAYYYRLNEVDDELLSFIGEDGITRTVARASDIGPELTRKVKADPQTRYRDLVRKQLEMFLIIGGRIVRRWDLRGKYIPIVSAIAKESVIEGVMDRKGHVRLLKDPQRMYNYWTSGAAENVALQSKAPWYGPAAAIEGYEGYWNNANTQNFSFLAYNHVDERGNPIPPPTRAEPVQMGPAFINGLQMARDEMMMVSGQYEAMLGEQGNERTGVAILERQRPGDKAVYHYVAAIVRAMRYTGRIILDMMPNVYTAPRLIQVMAEDQSFKELMIDPGAQYQTGDGASQEAVKRVLNPTVGKYDVQVAVGPSYGTRRREAFQALTEIMGMRPELVQVIGDLMFKAAEFPLSDEAAERLKRMVPAQALGGPSPEVLALQEQVNSLQQSLAAAIQALGDEAAKIKVDQEHVVIDAFKAETDRIKALMDQFEPGALTQLIQKTVQQAMNTPLDQVENTAGAFLEPPLVPPGTSQVLGQEPPSIAQPLLDQYDASPAPSGAPAGGDDTTIGGVPAEGNLDPTEAIAGMRRAPDGNYYIPDPNRPGKYMQVMGFGG